jgi:hypothetical protein
MKWLIILFLFILACAEPPPPKLVVVPSQTQLRGHLGMYWQGTIFLAPGATWEVLQHELDHHKYGSLGEESIW